ncbi:PTS system N-acetylmuramate-specific IIB component (Glc family) /PTS system N-acetylmuramate-specific IIC component (Glc family) [Pantoea ananatis]|uniref:PTS N-acetylmuramic acid transporter subunit IIBC n=1 Tax=Pantoea TaxID=53335 RepID=UPI000B600797|nr:MULTISPECIES: PTS N-acetylmuramic acid transporter subunit IIBC [Pantoea]ASN16890.1 PTS N-acetylmuramic acid transporter subunits IIBC [Pantoea ananatis]MCS4494851.1 PTS N-acetylmuramic acid transporter subunit IIBC [Pantoea sp. B623]PQK78901.1 PTS N-acetylmuramic acid transporter subunits IIBC [Pantoea ananatis]PVY84910.1 PTS system N-acetylmuramate-specific IIB component (Glc family) /PTS system N-acetylmuramate-specific IIC component (Glc family) [Pantoea ananatis]RAR72359.1 PTS system N
MAKMTDALLHDIVQAVGGAANIVVCGNCMTRLRLMLRHNQADIARLKRLPGVLGVIDSDDQLQIVLGPGKAQTAAERMQAILAQAQGDAAVLHQVAAEQKQQIKARQTGALQQFLARFATIFTPLIPGFIAAGLLLGFATLIEQSLHLSTPGDHPGWLIQGVAYMKVFGKGLFTFLSILIGYNAQKAFGGTGVNGAIIASLFILGYVPDAKVGYYSGMDSFFGLAIDPRGNIIGVLLAAMFGGWLERRLRTIIPDNLDMILTSLLTLLITGALTYLLIMPVGGELFKGMSWLFIHLNNNPFGCALLAGLFLIAVMFGIHQGFIPVYFALMETQGFNSLFPILAMAGAGQVGASLALWCKAEKGALLRAQIKGAIVPGLLGVGEPLIYGVTLPRLKPFITACCGGAVGGFFIGLVAWLGLPVGMNTVFGPSGLVTLPLMTSHQGIFAGMAVYLGGLIVAWVSGFLLTWWFGTRNVDLR